MTKPRATYYCRYGDLIDVQAAVPAGFVTAKDEDRATMLLEALELPGYSREAALAAAGLAGFRLPAIPAGLHPLEDIEKVMGFRDLVNSESMKGVTAYAAYVCNNCGTHSRSANRKHAVTQRSVV